LLHLAFQLGQLLIVVLGLCQLAVELVLLRALLLLALFEVGLVLRDVLEVLAVLFLDSVLVDVRTQVDHELEQDLDLLVGVILELLIDAVELLVAVLPEVHLVSKTALFLGDLVGLLLLVDDFLHDGQPLDDGLLELIKLDAVLVVGLVGEFLEGGETALLSVLDHLGHVL